MALAEGLSLLTADGSDGQERGHVLLSRKRRQLKQCDIGDGQSVFVLARVVDGDMNLKVTTESFRATLGMIPTKL
jgi:hypothetical protein